MAATNYPHPILDFTLQYEGFWSNNPRDPGGATMQGVTLSTFRQFYGASKTAADLKAISAEQIAHIYSTGYWKTIDGDNLLSGPDLVAFDISVNSGPARAKAWLAECGGKSAVEQVTYLCDRRDSFWRSLSTFSTFGKGWTARGQACRSAAMKLARAPIPAAPVTTPPAPVPPLPPIPAPDVPVAASTPSLWQRIKSAFLKG